LAKYKICKVKFDTLRCSEVGKIQDLPSKIWQATLITKIGPEGEQLQQFGKTTWHQ
jgi:hypothetical protein